MKRALKLARKGIFTTSSNPCVGCVLVKNNKIIGEGYHQYKGQAHAENFALQNATENPENCTAYVTLEPCSHVGDNPPCANLLIDAKVKKVVICNSDPNPLVNGNGVEKLKNAGIEVIEGVLESKGIQLNGGFLRRMKTGLPFVRLKIKQSENSKKPHKNIHYWRARSQAIITDIDTILQNDCRLTVRPESLPKKYQKLKHDFENQQPMRVILDSNLETPLDARALNNKAQRILFTQINNTKKIADLKNLGAKVIVQSRSNSKNIDVEKVIQWLGTQQVNEVLVETDTNLSQLFIDQNLVSQIIIHNTHKNAGSPIT